MAERADLMSTGIEGLDVVLGGGIPPRVSIIVTGDPGAGKTVLCSQIAFTHAKAGGSVVLATVTSESHMKMLDGLRSLSFFDETRVGKELFFVSAYPSMKKGSKETRDMLLATVSERKATLLFMDGMRAIRDLWHDESAVREFLYELSVGLAARGCIGLFTTEYALMDLLQLPEATTLDGIISLSMVPTGVRRARRLEVLKLRGRKHLLGLHTLAIKSTGVSVFPRLEATLDPSRTPQLPPARAAFGLEGLDGLLLGGVPVGSTTLLVGCTGIGKTFLACHFAVEGARQGEKSFLFSLTESPAALLERAARVGLDLKPFVDSGALRLSLLPAMNVSADELADEMLREASAFCAKRVVIDSLHEIEAALSDKERMYEFLAALVWRLRQYGATILFTKQITIDRSMDVDFSETPLVATAENLISLRRVEGDCRLVSVVNILKMRDSDYDSSLREFLIGSQGIRVADPFKAADRASSEENGAVPASSSPLATA